MKRAFALVCLGLAVPIVAQSPGEPVYLLDFKVEKNGELISEGSTDPFTGHYATQEAREAHPPACKRGGIETGYRKTTLYLSKRNNSGLAAHVYFDFSEYRRIEDDDNDPCAGQRPADEKFSFHGNVSLEPGESTVIDAGNGVTIELTRR